MLFDEIERLKIFAGAKDGNPLWKALKQVLTVTREEAIRALISEPPENLAKIAEYQVSVRLIDSIFNMIESAPEELKITEEQAHG